MQRMRKTIAATAKASPLLAKWAQRYAEWRRARSLEPPPAMGPDGLPMPDAFLMTMVAGGVDWRRFLDSGERELAFFADGFARHGAPMGEAERILDFGCGCGRLARHLPRRTEAEIIGVDYNGRLAGWCARHLPGRFAQNRLSPPLNLPGAHVDLIYLMSVFTHLRIDTQNAWLAEFARVLKPQGLVAVTFHDERHHSIQQAGVDAAALAQNGWTIRNDRAEGSNFVAAYQTEAFARRQFETLFDVLEITPSPDTPMRQAVAILRKRP